ncbi:MAG: hypothetical protein M0P01_15485 [Treponema sp.]|nr:hypothetical protein [Treponema sp.]
MITTSGCANNNYEKIQVPGNPSTYDYGITFDLDWDVYDSGTYSYGPLGSEVERMGGGTTGYRLFHELTLDFKFKNGQEYQEKIDLRPLIKKMLVNHEFPDLSKSKWGGSVDIRIIVEQNRLSIVYYIYKRRRNENGQKRLSSMRYEYPLFEKNLN